MTKKRGMPKLVGELSDKARARALTNFHAAVRRQRERGEVEIDWDRAVNRLKSILAAIYAEEV